VFQKSDAKIQITITTAHLIRMKQYPLSGCNYHLSDVNVANFNKIHRTVSEQQLFKKKLKTEVSNSTVVVVVVVMVAAALMVVLAVVVVVVVV